MLVLRWLLFPVSLIYAFITWLRNRLYDLNFLKSESFELPVVVVGNLAVGGTGKSPMTEYILRVVADQHKVAVLSRGYGRKTKGFRYVEADALAHEVGDEPLQFKRKFPNNTVVVSENRCLAIHKLAPDHDAILLDDAFQHRRLKPSFSILLFDYASLLKPIISLPTGNFRDSLLESRRANIIVITKTPATIDSQSRFAIMSKLARYSKAPIFFSSIMYSDIVNANGQTLSLPELSKTSVLLFTGIAKPAPLQAFVEQNAANVQVINYADHHNFTEKNIQAIKDSFNQLPGSNKIILTTEKDFQRLNKDFYSNYPLYYIPIRQKINFDQDKQFESLIQKAFCSPSTVN